jgi:hypothetical protein
MPIQKPRLCWRPLSDALRRTVAQNAHCGWQWRCLFLLYLCMLCEPFGKAEKVACPRRRNIQHSLVKATISTVLQGRMYNRAKRLVRQFPVFREEVAVVGAKLQSSKAQRCARSRARLSVDLNGSRCYSSWFMLYTIADSP